MFRFFGNVGVVSIVCFAVLNDQLQIPMNFFSFVVRSTFEFLLDGWQVHRIFYLFVVVRNLGDIDRILENVWTFFISKGIDSFNDLLFQTIVRPGNFHTVWSMVINEVKISNNRGIFFIHAFSPSVASLFFHFCWLSSKTYHPPIRSSSSSPLCLSMADPWEPLSFSDTSAWAQLEEAPSFPLSQTILPALTWLITSCQICWQIYFLLACDILNSSSVSALTK